MKPLALLLAWMTVPGSMAPGQVRADIPERPNLVVMGISLHPADEDGSTLAYYRFGRDAIAYHVALTESIQIDGIAMDATIPEMREAARIVGSQAFLLPLGPLSHLETAPQIIRSLGGSELILDYLVHLMRHLKPDVVYINPVRAVEGNPTHPASEALRILAMEAFSRTPDTSYVSGEMRSPEEEPWRPGRLFLRHSADPGMHTVALPIGEIFGPEQMSFAEIGLESQYAYQMLDDEVSTADELPERAYFTLLRSETGSCFADDDLAADLVLRDYITADLSHWIDSGRLNPLPYGSISLSDSVAVAGESVTVNVSEAALPAGNLVLLVSGAAEESVEIPSNSDLAFEIHISERATPTYPAADWRLERLAHHPPVLYSVHNVDEDVVLAAGYLPLEIAPPITLTRDDEPLSLMPGTIGSIPVRGRVFSSGHGDVYALLALRSNGVAGRIVHQQQTRLQIDSRGEFEQSVDFRMPSDLAPGTYTLVLNTFAQGSPAGTPPTRQIRRVTVSGDNSQE